MTGELAKALAAAQAQLGGAKRDGTNPHFRSSYATLASVWDAWQAVGPRHGLAITQTARVADGVTVLVTTLHHEGGETISGEYPLEPTKRDPQGMGSAMTYARRYCLAAMVGIAPEDDDGNAASAPAPPPAPRPDVAEVESAILAAPSLDALRAVFDGARGVFHGADLERIVAAKDARKAGLGAEMMERTKYADVFKPLDAKKEKKK